MVARALMPETREVRGSFLPSEDTVQVRPLIAHRDEQFQKAFELAQQILPQLKAVLRDKNSVLSQLSTCQNPPKLSEEESRHGQDCVKKIIQLKDTLDQALLAQGTIWEILHPDNEEVVSHEVDEIGRKLFVACKTFIAIFDQEKVAPHTKFMEAISTEVFTSSYNWERIEKLYKSLAKTSVKLLGAATSTYIKQFADFSKAAGQ